MANITLSEYECDHDLLPDVCVVCGGPATVRKARVFSWFPGWVWILILVSWIVVLIVALILTKKRVAQMPVCDRHAGYWRLRAATLWVPSIVIVGGWSAFALYVISQPVGAMDEDLRALLCFGSSILLVVWVIIAALIYANGVRVTEITDRDMSLAGVHLEFVEALREERAWARGDRYRRRKRYGDERDDYDDEPDDSPARRRPRDNWDDDDRPRRRRDDE